MGSNEIYREKISGSLDLERETLHISDSLSRLGVNTGRIAIVDTKTYDGGVIGSCLPAPCGPTNEIRYQIGNHLQSASLELDNTAAIISYEETACGSRSPLKAIRHSEQYHPFGTKVPFSFGSFDIRETNAFYTTELFYIRLNIWIRH